jgi:hypothetical protein
VSSDDAGRDSYIRHLYRSEKWTIRAIARQVGLSRSKVHRIVSSGPAVGWVDPMAAPDPDEYAGNGDCFDDDDSDEFGMFDEGPPLQPPIRYVGPSRPHGPERRIEPLWVDRTGALVNELQIYRHQAQLPDDTEFDADMARQLLAAGWWQLDHGGYHPSWEPPPAPPDLDPGSPPRCDCQVHRLWAAVWSYTPTSGSPLAGSPYRPDEPWPYRMEPFQRMPAEFVDDT